MEIFLTLVFIGAVLGWVVSKIIRTERCLISLIEGIEGIEGIEKGNPPVGK